MSNKKIMYIGGFKLPDKNAAAQRVIGIAYGLRELGHEVIFFNEIEGSEDVEREYYGFKCIERRKCEQFDYLFSANTAIQMIKYIKPDVVIAYNYPGIALNRIRKFCKKSKILCVADITEWHEPHGNILHRMVMGLDICVRMRYVHPRMDSLIVISKYLYDYYRKKEKIALIPPTVDCNNVKWNICEKVESETINFVYAGVPSSKKERLDLIVASIRNISQFFPVKLTVVGITEKEYMEIYNDERKIGEEIVFLGRLPHLETIEVVKNAQWSIILRENNKLVKAGFPTKVVESITCNTPVIINEFSNVLDYLQQDSCLVVELNEIEKGLREACLKKIRPNRLAFDYHNFTTELSKVIK